MISQVYLFITKTCFSRNKSSVCLMLFNCVFVINKVVKLYQEICY